ncbi:unnamed protein product [Chrysoparadoxa australica]
MKDCLLQLGLAALLCQADAFLSPGGLPAAARRSQESRPLSMAYDVSKSPNKWGNQELEPGFGGIWPGDPKAPTHEVTLVDKSGEVVQKFDVPVDRYIYFAAEDAGVDTSAIINSKRMCRNGCCTTCAGKVLEGKVKRESGLGLLKDMRKKGYTLMCCTYPRSDLVIELQDEDEVYRMQWGDTFESGGVEWGGFLPEED